MLRNDFRIDTIAVMQKRRELLASFDAFWTRLFDSPIHLDSALAKESEATRAELAVVVPKILRAPLALARRAGVRVAPGEPWSLDHAALGRWAPARKIAEALFVEHDLSRAEIEGGIEDGEARVRVLFIDAEDASDGIEAIGRHAEKPLRLAEFRRDRVQRDHVVAVDAIEIPPTAAVGYNMKLPRG